MKQVAGRPHKPTMVKLKAGCTVPATTAIQSCRLANYIFEVPTMTTALPRKYYQCTWPTMVLDGHIRY